MTTTHATDLDIDLTDRQCEALVTCFKAGLLTRSEGYWRGSMRDRPVTGGIVATLMRDGMLDVYNLHCGYRNGRAYLTDAGKRVALVLASRREISKAEARRWQKL